MNKRRKSVSKPRKQKRREVVKYLFLASYDEVERFFDCVLQYLDVTMEDKAVSQKAYRFLCEYTDTYGPDHSLYVDEDGRVCIDHASSGWQAADRDWLRGLVKLSVFHEE